MQPRYYVVVGASFVGLNMLYGGTVALSYARYGDGDRGALGMTVSLIDSPIGYLVAVVAVLTLGYALHLERRDALLP